MPVQSSNATQNPDLRILHLEDNPMDAELEALKHLIRSEEWHGELTKIGKAGQSVIVESRWTLLRDEAGQPKSILVIDADITERKQIEAELLRTQRMQTIGALAGRIAHDLNNVLSPILLVAHLIRDELASEESRQMLDTATASAQRGAALIVGCAHRVTASDVLRRHALPPKVQ